MTRCHGKSYCKSDEEIREFIDDHIMFTIYNDQSYNPNNFDDDQTIE